jgi:hypothetical protein
MAVSRRSFGIGLLAASAAGTGGYVYLRQHPEIAGRFGEPKRLFGFAGGEKEGFLANARVRDLLERRFGLILDARRAGSVEMVRERALLDQKPQFLWRSSSILVEVARNSGVKISRDQVIFNSPIVLYSWDRIADGLVKGGFAEPAGGPRYSVDLLKILKAVIAGETWAAMGVTDLFGRARIVSTDPNKSNSGFMFAGSCGEPALRRRRRARPDRPHRCRRGDRVPPDGVQAAIIGQAVRRLCGRRRRRPASHRRLRKPVDRMGAARRRSLETG